MITAAVILAAGMGKRMKSDLPKVLHLVLAKPMVERAARTAEAAGVTEITVVILLLSDTVARELFPFCRKTTGAGQYRKNSLELLML